MDLGTAAVVAAIVLAASMLSVELALSVAVVEIIFGVVAGNAFDLGRPQWLAFLATLGSVVLTFQAGAEIDTAAMRRTLVPSVAIGLASFAAPFLGALVRVPLSGGMDVARGGDRWRRAFHDESRGGVCRHRRDGAVGD